jgi:uncharacterized membrane protein YgdD (TMEM256/DUF423 family)
VDGKYWIVLASILGAMSVGLGAYHAHGLKAKLESDLPQPTDVAEQPDWRVAIDKRLHNCEVGVRYQMFNALALLVIGGLSLNFPSRLINVAGGLLLLGVGSFSGGLYLHAFTGNIGHFAIIPSGGLLQIIGWIVLAVAAFGLPQASRN